MKKTAMNAIRFRVFFLFTLFASNSFAATFVCGRTRYEPAQNAFSCKGLLYVKKEHKIKSARFDIHFSYDWLIEDGDSARNDRAVGILICPTIFSAETFFEQFANKSPNVFMGDFLFTKQAIVRSSEHRKYRHSCYFSGLHLRPQFGIGAPSEVGLFDSNATIENFDY